jgi:hypothetical protein
LSPVGVITLVLPAVILVTLFLHLVNRSHLFCKNCSPTWKFLIWIPVPLLLSMYKAWLPAAFPPTLLLVILIPFLILDPVAETQPKPLIPYCWSVISDIAFWLPPVTVLLFNPCKTLITCYKIEFTYYKHS